MSNRYGRGLVPVLDGERDSSRPSITNLQASRGRPNLDERTITRSDIFAVGRQGHDVYGSGVIEGEKPEIRAGIPELYCPVSVRKSKTSAIRRPAHHGDGSTVAIGHRFTVDSCVPHLHQAIFSSTGNTGASSI